MLLDNMYTLRANQASNPIKLNSGTQVLRLTVTAEDRTTKLTYVITVNSPDTVPPSAPLVSVPEKVIIAAPVWTWSRTGGGIGGFRYRFDNPDLTAGAVTTTAVTLSPNLTDGPHTLYVQEKDSAGNWSESGSASTMVMQGPASWYKLDNGDYLDHGFNGNHGTAVGITSVADRYSIEELSTFKRIFYDFKPVFTTTDLHERIIELTKTYPKDFGAFYDRYDLNGILESFYRIGVVGNRKTLRDGNYKFRFCFRGDDDILLEQEIMIHPALKRFFGL